jgi:hypothetical protein
MEARLYFIYRLNFSSKIELMYFVSTSFKSLAVYVRIHDEAKSFTT